MTYDLISWMRLAYTKNVGPVSFWQAVQRFGSAKGALDWLQSQGKADAIPSIDAMSKIIDQAETKKITILTGENPDYPKRLKILRDSPAVLYCRGQIERLNGDCIAIVGARNCSFSGKKQASELAAKLGKCGFITVSGLARGIDYAAHRGSCESGTIAVLAGGVDVIYPPEHEELYKQIQINGCIVSEMPIGMKPSPNHFPRRNRIVSGLSRGVVVVEAALKSGSLITAKYALDQSREVFAVPGSPQDPRCHGSNMLLKQGAHLIQTVDDIVAILKPEFDLSQISAPVQEACVIDIHDYIVPTSLKEEIHQGLSRVPVDINYIAQDLGLSAQEIMTILLELELEGLIVRHANGTVSILDQAA